MAVALSMDSNLLFWVVATHVNALAACWGVELNLTMSQICCFVSCENTPSDAITKKLSSSEEGEM